MAKWIALRLHRTHTLRRAVGQEEWDEKSEAYLKHLDALRQHLPHDFRTLLDDYRLHDAQVMSRINDNGRYLIELRPETSPDVPLLLTYVLANGQPTPDLRGSCYRTFSLGFGMLLHLRPRAARLRQCHIHLTEEPMFHGMIVIGLALGGADATQLKPGEVVSVCRIIIVGNTRTPDDVILEAIRIVPGEKVTAQTLRQAETNLMRLGAFEADPEKGIRPTVTAIPIEDAGYRDILIRVKEAPPPPK